MTPRRRVRVPLAALAVRTLPRPRPGGEEVLPTLLGAPLPRDVHAALRARAELGRVRYGVPHTAHNGRLAAVDYLQEQLDAAAYAAQRGIESRGWRAMAWRGLTLLSGWLAWAAWRLG